MTRHIRLDHAAAAPLDCDAFARLLADWLEGDLRPTLRAAADRHVAECAGCGALAASLDDLRVEAAALPPIEPPRDLWAGIERRIGTRVVELPVSAPAARRGPRIVRIWSSLPMRAAAAALLVAGVGVAAWVAVGGDRSSASAVAAAPIALPGVAVPTPDAGTVRDAAPAPRLVASAGPARPSGRAAGVASSAAAPRPSAPTSPLDAEIATLRRTLETRRTTLDTATVRAIEANLAILDGAIRESRAALVDEPTSQLLHEQLNHALDAKLELMRTAVILSGED